VSLFVLRKKLEFSPLPVNEGLECSPLGDKVHSKWQGTRLGEISSLGQLFTIEPLLLKNTKLWATFSVVKVICALISTQMDLGVHFGRFFFTNSSGHPA
jgi:hypothetical protein